MWNCFKFNALEQKQTVKIIYKKKLTSIQNTNGSSMSFPAMEDQSSLAWHQSVIWASRFPLKQNKCSLTKMYKFNKNPCILEDLPREVWCFPFSASPDIQSSVCDSCVPQVFHFLRKAERSAYGEPRFPAEKETKSANKNVK